MAYFHNKIMAKIFDDTISIGACPSWNLMPVSVAMG